MTRKLSALARVTRWFSGSPCKRHGEIDACEAKRDLRKLLAERGEAAVKAVERGCDPVLDNWANFIRAAVMGGKR